MITGYDCVDVGGPKTPLPDLFDVIVRDCVVAATSRTEFNAALNALHEFSDKVLAEGYTLEKWYEAKEQATVWRFERSTRGLVTKGLT